MVIRRIFALVVLAGLSANGQSLAPPDTAARILPVDSFIHWVELHHPLARQARLQWQEAQAQLLEARGGFDPKLYGSVDNKDFDDKNYYNLEEYGLAVPTWFGLSAKGGFERNRGVFVNPENNVPTSGLLSAELALTLGKGLFIDERRAALQQAKLLEQSAGFEVQQALNDLYRDALESYWDWYAAFRQMQILREALDLAQERYLGVYESARVGESATIDTLEAYLQVQSRRLRWQQSLGDLAQAQNKAATFLWLEGQVPLQLDSLTQPLLAEVQIPQIEVQWLENHPLLRFYQLKQERLDIDRRLAAEQLKPQVDLRYKFITENTGPDFLQQYNPEDFEWGLSASFPILLRKERGKLQQTKLKLQDNALTLAQKSRSLQNEVNGLLEAWQQTLAQMREAEAMTDNYRRLWQAEITKFENGESSLFLVNSRETKYVESREKLAQLQSKVQALKAKVEAKAGNLATFETPQ